MQFAPPVKFQSAPGVGGEGGDRRNGRDATIEARTARKEKEINKLERVVLDWEEENDLCQPDM